MQFHYGLSSNGVLRVCRVREASQNACVDQDGHYS